MSERRAPLYSHDTEEYRAEDAIVSFFQPYQLPHGSYSTPSHHQFAEMPANAAALMSMYYPGQITSATLYGVQTSTPNNGHIRQNYVQTPMANYPQTVQTNRPVLTALPNGGYRLELWERVYSWRTFYREDRLLSGD